MSTVRAVAARRGAAALPVAGLMLVVAILAGLELARVVAPAGLASSPRLVAEGRLWLLFSSGVVCDRPVALSAASFVVLAPLTLAVVGPRVLWLSAFLGHVGSTFLVYLLLGLARLVVAGAFASLVTAPDFGVSAVESAWVGAIAAVLWRRGGGSRWRRVAIVGSIVVVGLVAWLVRPDLTLLDTNHGFAFGAGIVAAVWLAPRSHARRRSLETGSPDAVTASVGRPP